MFGRIVRDLTLSNLAFTGGPLVVAVLSFAKAARVDAAFDRWAWIAVGAVMVIICLAYLAWAWRNRSRLRDQ
ncbi:hypothetical protein QLQ12_33565 [Actinoplanes sp. NEAU-A12]|uniref:Uncharacterized protein n=1 Tax=Actinoplanes sandaracinus TaxID=3045177 RepID=A0ABT6WV95_9ACTN|nr:hypothetical protein [Actinoplanes sandaracinus]MDI6103551.1 hypothetical protein [Actinoplanes sandaracinus]